jgi:hypothetical protein
LQVEEAVVLEWDLAAARMLIRCWTPTAGESVCERAYP